MSSIYYHLIEATYKIIKIVRVKKSTIFKYYYYFYYLVLLINISFKLLLWIFFAIIIH